MKEIREALMAYVVGDDALSDHAQKQLDDAVIAVSKHPKGSIERLHASIDASGADLVSAIGYETVKSVLEKEGLL